jgi:hypothetical protein
MALGKGKIKKEMMILKTRRQTRKHIHRTVINDSFI